MVPASAIGNPSAADVPTASWIFTLHHVMNGTEMKAPPAPTSDDTPPIAVPTPKVPAGPGRVRLGLGLRFSSICVAEKATKTAKNTPMNLAGKACATCAPSSEPTRMPGASVLTTGQSTAPRWLCARTEEIEVNAMVASEVATALFTVYSGG